MNNYFRLLNEHELTDIVGGGGPGDNNGGGGGGGGGSISVFVVNPSGSRKLPSQAQAAVKASAAVASSPVLQLL